MKKIDKQIQFFKKIGDLEAVGLFQEIKKCRIAKKKKEIKELEEKGFTKEIRKLIWEEYNYTCSSWNSWESSFNPEIDDIFNVKNINYEYSCICRMGADGYKKMVKTYLSFYELFKAEEEYLTERKDKLVKELKNNECRKFI